MQNRILATLALAVATVYPSLGMDSQQNETEHSALYFKLLKFNQENQESYITPAERGKEYATLTQDKMISEIAKENAKKVKLLNEHMINMDSEQTDFLGMVMQELNLLNQPKRFSYSFTPEMLEPYLVETTHRTWQIRKDDLIFDIYAGGGPIRTRPNLSDWKNMELLLRIKMNEDYTLGIYNLENTYQSNAGYNLTIRVSKETYDKYHVILDKETVWESHAFFASDADVWRANYFLSNYTTLGSNLKANSVRQVSLEPEVPEIYDAQLDDAQLDEILNTFNKTVNDTVFAFVPKTNLPPID